MSQVAARGPAAESAAGAEGEGEFEGSQRNTQDSLVSKLNLHIHELEERLSPLCSLQLTQRLKTAKRQMDQAEEEIERLLMSSSWSVVRLWLSGSDRPQQKHPG